MLLIEEIEALHVELWNAKAAVAIAEDAGDAGDPEDDSHDELDRTLGARLRRLSPSRRRA